MDEIIKDKDWQLDVLGNYPELDKEIEENVKRKHKLVKL